MMVWRFLCLLLVFLCQGCYSIRPMQEPMNAIYDNAPETSEDRIALVMLPGARDRPDDFAAQGFIQSIRKRGLPIDVIAVDAHLNYYLEQKILGRLSADIIGPLRAHGYSRIWLLGISIGGLGAIRYSSQHPDNVEGVFLLAPFLGTRGVIAQVRRVGGLDYWRPDMQSPGDDEQMALMWLKDYRADDSSLPVIYLGYGQSDRYAMASQVLAARLPSEHVIAIDGDHDWSTWTELWERMLDKKPFANGKREQRTPTTSSPQRAGN
jgi:pimeloyl-ACP methyl ester carboxylesterase